MLFRSSIPSEPGFQEHCHSSARLLCTHSKLIVEAGDNLFNPRVIYDVLAAILFGKFGNGNRATEWGSAGKDARFLNRLCRFLAAMSESDRELLLGFAEKIPKRRK